MKFLLALLLVGVAHSAWAKSVETKGSNYKMVCYYGSWAVYRPGAGKFDVENIDPYICTHIVYGFTGLDSSSNKMITLDSWNDLYDNWGKGAMNRFVALKNKNPSLKAMIAIGGWNEGSEKYSKMASSPTSRATFIKSVVDFLDYIGFDGLDLDWEYPANRGGAASDMQNYVSLIKELKAAFAPKGYLLTAAVSCGYATIDTAYNIPAVAAALDFINLMCYDFHGAWEPFTGHNAPLHVNPNIDVGDNATWNSEYAVNYWISKGAPASKLVLGMPLYGRGFTLNSVTKNGLYAPASQPIPAGPYTREAGFWGYNEICSNIAQGGWTTVVDPYYQAPYMYKGNLWMGYDDAASLAKKTQFVMDKGLGGAMVWSLETDDFTGSCSGTPFVLIKSIVATLNGGVLPTAPTPDPNAPTTTPRTTTVATPPPSELCKAPGYHRDPNNCANFYNCVNNGQGGWTVYSYTCPTGTVFDLVSTSCTWPQNVPECNGEAPQTTTTTTTTAALSTTTTTTAAPITTTATATTPMICVPTSTLAALTTTTTTAAPTPLPTTATPIPHPLCTGPGYIRDPIDCAVFYQCVSSGNGGWITYSYRCSGGTVFDASSLSCTWPWLVPGCENYVGEDSKQ